MAFAVSTGLNMQITFHEASGGAYLESLPGLISDHMVNNIEVNWQQQAGCALCKSPRQKCELGTSLLSEYRTVDLRLKLVNL
jgi:hypothetical protein